MYEALTIGVISGVFGIISMFIGIKICQKYARNMVFEMVDEVKEDLKDQAEEWLNSEKGQKALWSIGAMIGNGVKGGVGLNKSGGKRGIQGLILDIAGTYFRGKNESKLGVEGADSVTQPLNRA